MLLALIEWQMFGGVDDRVGLPSFALDDVGDGSMTVQRGLAPVEQGGAGWVDACPEPRPCDLTHLVYHWCERHGSRKGAGAVG